MKKKCFLLEDVEDDEIEFGDVFDAILENGSFEDIYEDYGNEVFYDNILPRLIDGPSFTNGLPDNISNADNFIEEFRPSEADIRNSEYIRNIVLTEARRAFEKIYQLDFGEIYNSPDFYHKDYSLNFLESLFLNEPWDYFDSYDYDINETDCIEYCVRFADDSSKDYIRALPMWKNNELDFDKLLSEDNVLEDSPIEFDDLLRILERAALRAQADGAASEALDDFESALKNALPRGVEIRYPEGSSYRDMVVSFDEWLRSKDDSKVVDDIVYEADSYYIQDAIRNIIINEIADKFNFYEPHYGWYGFSKESYTMSLDDELYDEFNHLLKK